MVGGFQEQQGPRIRDLYFGVLDAVMHAESIQPLQWRPSHVVQSGASYEEVVQYTDWFCRRSDRIEHYRYNRYREMLGYLQPDSSRTGSRVSHVDIGCGAGLFSWAFLDWAGDSNLEFDRIDLYGLDHSPAMVALSHLMRYRLVEQIPDYPELRYETNLQMLLQALTANHRDPTDYIITLGHVLAQAHTHGAIINFTQVIVHILGLVDDQSNCAMVAADAQGWASEFTDGWDLLRSSLEEAGINYEIKAVPQTAINDDSRAKFAWLSHARRMEDQV